MIVCIDLDGTITAAPDFFAAEMFGLRLMGFEVHVLSGAENGIATPADKDLKRQLRHSLGVMKGVHYDKLAVINGPHDKIPKNKVRYMQQVGATHLIDNRKGNCKAAAKAGFGVFI
jgi:uncharacterized HAD superfamily protein